MLKRILHVAGVLFAFATLVLGLYSIVDSFAPERQIPYQAVTVRLTEDAVTLQQGTWSREPVHVAAGSLLDEVPVDNPRVRLEVEPTAARGDIVAAYYNEHTNTVVSEKPLSYTADPQVSPYIWPFIPSLVVAVVGNVLLWRPRRKAG